MVAGAAQSIEGGPSEGYGPQQSYYQQFYSALSLGDSSSRHPKCTCPEPLPTKPSIQVTSKHPKCTCPSPPRSSSPSPAVSHSPSPELVGSGRSAHCVCPISSNVPDSSFLGQPTFRHPRCTCPTPPPLTLPLMKPKCTCPDPKHNGAGDGNKRHSKKSRGIVRAVLLDAPNKSPILSTDREHYIKLHHSPISVTTNSSPIHHSHISVSPITSPVLVHRLQNGSRPITPVSKHEMHHSETDLPKVGHKGRYCNRNGIAGHSNSLDDDIIHCNSTILSPTISPVLSPAKKVREKLSTLRQKVVSSFSRTSSLRRHNSIDTGGFEEDVNVSGIDNIDKKQYKVTSERCYATINSKARYHNLNKSLLVDNAGKRSYTSTTLLEQHSNNTTCGNIESDQPFSLDELPSPILNDITSPLGSVPPLSPQSESSSMTLGSTPTLAMSPNFSLNGVRSESRGHAFSLSSNVDSHSKSFHRRTDHFLPDSISNEYYIDSENLTSTKTPSHKAVRRLQPPEHSSRPTVTASTFQSSGKSRKSHTLSSSSRSINLSSAKKNDYNRSQSLVDVNSDVDVHAVLLKILNNPSLSPKNRRDFNRNNKHSSNKKLDQNKISSPSVDKRSTEFYSGVSSSPVEMKGVRGSYSSMNSLASSTGQSRPSSRSSIPVTTSCTNTISPKKCALPDKVNRFIGGLGVNSSLELSKDDLDILISILENYPNNESLKNRESEQQSLYRTRSLDTKDLIPRQPKYISPRNEDSYSSSSLRSSKISRHYSHQSNTQLSPPFSRSTSLRSQRKKKSVNNVYSNHSHPNPSMRNLSFSSAKPFQSPPRCSSPVTEEQSKRQTSSRRKVTATSKQRYENVVFHEAGDYIMLSKQIMDQWQLPYEFTYPSLSSSISTSGTDLAEGRNISRNNVIYLNEDDASSNQLTSRLNRISPASSSSTPSTPTLLELAERHVGGLLVDTISYSPKKSGMHSTMVIYQHSIPNKVLPPNYYCRTHTDCL